MQYCYWCWCCFAARLQYFSPEGKLKMLKSQWPNPHFCPRFKKSEISILPNIPIITIGFFPKEGRKPSLAFKGGEGKTSLEGNAATKAPFVYFIEGRSLSSHKWRCLHLGGALMEHFLEGSTLQELLWSNSFKEMFHYDTWKVHNSCLCLDGDLPSMKLIIVPQHTVLTDCRHSSSLVSSFLKKDG